MTRPPVLGLLGSLTSHSLTTCLVCMCLGSSVYLDSANLEYIPPLPHTYLYAHFNHIGHLRAGDFRELTKLKRIDLSSNFIFSISDDVLHFCLPDLILPENKLVALPTLPSGIEFLDTHLNWFWSSGIQTEAFWESGPPAHHLPPPLHHPRHCTHILVIMGYPCSNLALEYKNQAPFSILSYLFY
ncbi:LOW QUALITY PROTEIN: opticin [Dugong dugon]